jgi:hypothetical protein
MYEFLWQILVWNSGRAQKAALRIKYLQQPPKIYVTLIIIIIIAAILGTSHIIRKVLQAET